MIDLSKNEYGIGMRVVSFATLFYGSAKAFAEARGLTKAVPSRKLCKLTNEGTERIVKHDKFGKFYKYKSTGLWWAKDKAGQRGSSSWKVFKATDNGLNRIHDADRFGDYIATEYNSFTGEFIPGSELHGK